MINCVIIDDEPLAREGIASYVSDVPFLTLIATFESAVEYSKLLPQPPIDLIFLDIQMPKITGLDFLRTIQHPPMVIITTAYSEYALDGFQLNVLDYLVKPVTFHRFFKSVNKARDYYQLLNRQQPAVEDYFFVKCGTKYEKIYYEEVLFVEGLQNYITIYTSKGKYITLHNLKLLEEEYLNNQAFLRVHKSYLVAVNKIESIQGNEIFMGAHRIPISRNYREEVLQKVVLRKLWDKSK